MTTDEDDGGPIIPALLSKMLDRLGITGEEVRMNRSFAAASRRCLKCPKMQVCGHWLELSSARTAPLFCPNAAFLRRVKEAGGSCG